MAGVPALPRGRSPCGVLGVLAVLHLEVLSSQAFDLRVSKGIYTRDYDSVRLSVIADRGEAVPASFAWAWEKPFIHRWTTKTLRTKLLKVGSGKTVSIGGHSVKLKLPAAGSGVTGLLVSDPCFTRVGGPACPNGRRFRVLERLSRLVNTLVGSDEFHFWGLLGDNFYDQDGNATSEFYSRLTLAAKSKLFMTTAGNHDFWVGGSPPGSVGDQLGFGHMQFYGQDTVAAKGLAPYNFAGSPDKLHIASADNFIFGTQIGDLAFFGYAGAHSWSDTAAHAHGFCDFVGKTPTVHSAVVLGHWNVEERGCSPGMDVASVWKRMKTMGGCRAKKMFYFTGHEHCNRVDGDGNPLSAVGFVIGGTGMKSDGCSQFGFTVIQSHPDAAAGGNVRVEHFPLVEDPPPGRDRSKFKDNFDSVYGCLKTHGYAGCRTEHGLSYRALSQDSIVPPASAARSASHAGPASRLGAKADAHRGIFQSMLDAIEADSVKDEVLLLIAACLAAAGASAVVVGLLWSWLIRSKQRVAAGRYATMPNSGTPDMDGPLRAADGLAGEAAAQDWWDDSAPQKMDVILPNTSREFNSEQTCFEDGPCDLMAEELRLSDYDPPCSPLARTWTAEPHYMFGLDDDDDPPLTPGGRRKVSWKDDASRRRSLWPDDSIGPELEEVKHIEPSGQKGNLGPVREVM